MQFHSCPDILKATYDGVSLKDAYGNMPLNSALIHYYEGQWPVRSAWVLTVNSRYGMVDVRGIRFCPFCGEELGAESESDRAARLAKAAEIAKADSNDPDDDPYDRPWDE